MTLSNSPTSILKETNIKFKRASKRSHPSYTKRRYLVPPSLRHLPTMSSSPNSSFAPLGPSSSSSSSSSSSNDEPHLDLSETMLDKWLVRLDKVAKSSSRKDRDATDAPKTRSTSKVTFAVPTTTPSSSSTSSRTLPTVLDSVARVEQQAQSQQHRPAKRRRFNRRNSFIVRDLSQLAQLAPAGGHPM